MDLPPSYFDIASPPRATVPNSNTKKPPQQQHVSPTPNVFASGGDSGTAEKSLLSRLANFTASAASADLRTLTINGEQYEIPSDISPLTSLAQFIRSKTRFTGTKIACGEGMCGACTVILTAINPGTGEKESHGINACLRPVLACAGAAVLTNEGLVERDPKTLGTVFNPIQEALANHNGSQCGYCSSGFVMNMFDLLHNNGDGSDGKAPLTKLDVERAFDGNLCRCTGYRPILEAMHTFAPDAANTYFKASHSHDECAEDDCRKTGCKRRQKVFPDLEDLSNFIIKSTSKPYTQSETRQYLESIPLPPSAVHPAHKFKKARTSSEPKNEKKEEEEEAASLFTSDSFNNSWQEMISVDQLNLALMVFRDRKPVIVNAATSFGVFKNDRNLTNTTYLYIGRIPEFKRITHDASHVYVGGTVTIGTVISYLESLKVPAAPWKTKHFPQAIAHLKRIAGRQIRNAGSLAGNIMAALYHQSPADYFPSDGSIVLMGLGATVTVYDAIEKREYAWDMSTFFTQSRKRMEGRYILRISIPFASSPDEVFMTYKVAMRQQGAHAEVNAAMRATKTPNGGLAGGAVVAIGGIEASVRRYEVVEKLLSSAASYTDILFIKKACTTLRSALVCAPSGGRVEFRTATAVNCLYKFFMALMGNALPKELVTGAEPWPTRPVSSGVQSFFPDPKMFPVSKPMIKTEAPFQTSGLAKYTNDLPIPPNSLHARLVTATSANCVLESIDTSVASQLPGFVRFVGAADMLPNTNEWSNGFIMTPVGERIDHFGQVIGVVLAKDELTAWLACHAVVTTYSSQRTPIASLDDAITAGTYSDRVPSPIVKGDVDAAIGKATLKVKGSVQIGPQIHFFMENHTATVIPRDGEFEVLSATQMPVAVQMACAQVAGLPTSKVTVTTKLVGGGFGGKIGNTTQVAALATVCSALTGNAVTILVPQEQTSNTFGFRDVKRIDYTAGLTAEGRLEGLKLTVLSAAGAANTDEFGDSLVFLHSVDNCYNIPNVEFRAKILLTHYAPVAACRGPGWVHAVHAVEAIMSDISSKTSLDATALREKNFYNKGDFTPDGMELEHWTLQDVWSKLKESADYEGKLAAVEAFNKANRWRKRGLSIVPCRFGVGPTGANYDSLIAIYPDGTVSVSHGGNEIGQGVNTRISQVVTYALKELGFSEDNISIVSVKPTSTTTISAGSNVTGGSVTAEMCAASVLAAAEKIKKRLRPLKKEGQTWAQLISEAGDAGVALTATGWSDAPVAKGIFLYNVCAASLTVAEVDILTGQINIVSTDMVYDCGVSTSPLLDIGQIEGGFVYGIGMLVTEEAGWDARTAAINAPTHWKYKIPCSLDIPNEFNVALLKDMPNPVGVLGGKATGEPSVCMAASVPLAVESAITAARAANGLGTKRWVCTTYPLTIERAQQACGTTIDHYTL